jgi:hypothetical protein
VRLLVVVACLAALARAEVAPSPDPQADPLVVAPAPKPHKQRAWRIAAVTSLVTGTVLASIGAALIVLDGTCANNMTTVRPCSTIQGTTVIGAPLAAFGAAGVVGSIPFFVLGYSH